MPLASRVISLLVTLLTSCVLLGCAAYSELAYMHARQLGPLDPTLRVNLNAFTILAMLVALAVAFSLGAGQKKFRIANGVVFVLLLGVQVYGYVIGGKLIKTTKNRLALSFETQTKSDDVSKMESINRCCGYIDHSISVSHKCDVLTPCSRLIEPEIPYRSSRFIFLVVASMVLQIYSFFAIFLNHNSNEPTDSESLVESIA